MSGELDPLPPKEGVEKYLERRSNKLAEQTLRSHRHRLGPFLEFCEDREIDNLNDISGHTLDRYYNRRKGDVKDITLKNDLSTLGLALQYWADIDAVEQGLSESVPMPTLSISDEVNDDVLEGGLGLHGVAMFLFSVPPDAVLDELVDLYNNWRDSE